MTQQGSEEGQTSKVEPVGAEIEDIETLKQLLAEEKAKAESCLANWQRAQADFSNYKRRTEQEKEEIGKFANTTLMLSLLPVLDDLKRAFAAIPPRLAKLEWVGGIRLIDRKLQTGLEVQGLSEIKALGEPFDPHLHEAVRQDKGKEGIVTEEVQKGYILRDRVIRPTMVVVGNGEEEEQKKED
jgi:molecular chaperone GrpE